MSSITAFIAALAVILFIVAVTLFMRLRKLQSQLSPTETITPDEDVQHLSMVDALPIPVYRKSRNGQLCYINKAFEDMTGISRDTLPDNSVDEYNSPEFAAMYKAQDDKLFERGGDQIYEGKIKNQQSQSRDIVFHKRAIKNSQGDVTEIIGLAFDITDRKVIEQELLEQQRMFMSLVENLPDLIIRYDSNYRRTYVNPAYFSLTGTSASQVLGSSTGDIWTGDISFDEYQKRIKNVFISGIIENLTIAQPDRYGKKHLFSISLVPETTSTGQITGVFAIGHDITKLKEIENQFRNLTDHWPDEIATYDLKCRRTFINPSMQKTLQARGSKEQLLGKTPTETFPEIAAIQDYEKTLFHVLKTHEVCDYEMIWTGEPDQIQYRQIKMLPEYDIAGQISGVFTVARDITRRKLAELQQQKNLDFFGKLDRVNRTIQQSNDLNQIMNDTLKVILDIFNCDRAFLTFPLNPNVEYFSSLIEQTRPEYPGALLRNVKIHIDDDVRRMIQIELASDSPVRFSTHDEQRVPPSLAENFQVKSMLSMAIYPKIGSPWNFGLHQCSSDRNWTDEEVRLFNEISKRICDALTAALSYKDLEEGKRFIDGIFQHIPTMLYVKDAKTLSYVRVNKSAEEFMETTEAEMIGKTDFDFFNEETATFHRQKDMEALESQKLVIIPEEVLITSEGTKHFLRVKKMVMTDQAGKPTYLLVLTEDITTLKISQETTRQFTQVITQNPYSILFTDTEGHIEFANEKFYEQEKISPAELAQTNLKQLLDLDSDDLKEIGNVIREDGVWRQERQFSKSNGETMWKNLQVTAITDEEMPDNPITNFVILSEDISHRKQLEEQLQHSQKMEAIGQLAGGIAHDFNNMLGVIVGRTDLALNRLKPEDALYNSLQEVNRAANRSADLTRQLLAFARKQEVSPKILDLNEIVEGTLNMLRRLIGEDIGLAWLPSPSIWSIKMDPSQLDQILANLCVNARDAMSAGGKITIETANVPVDKNYCLGHSEASPGHFVKLSVSDNGSGIPAELLKKIFDPFFTTKELGKGTGLGLSTVYGIVKQNNGFINVYSEPGQGTTFSIHLPRNKDQQADNSQPEKTPLPRGIETILVVEDDQNILATETSMLEMLGYRVFAAETAAEAILLAEQYSGHIQLLISDVIMPDMNGHELVTLMTTHYPQLKILYMSGYTGDVIAHHGVLEEGVNFIQKPFSLHALATKVREVLDR